MIKIEHVVTPSPEQWAAIIRGMRNPMNSWDKSDSCASSDGMFVVGDDDKSLMERLAALGTDHRKYMRMIVVYMDITAPLYWWKEYDTYKVGTVANSCSTMHKIHEKEFTFEDFSWEHLEKGARRCLDGTITALNDYRRIYLDWDKLGDGVKMLFDHERKNAWRQLIQLLPSSYNQKRTVLLNYEVLRNMHHARKNHKLDEWKEFCKQNEKLPYSELITG